VKSEDNSLPGCQSQVWFKTEMRNDRIHYVADSDSLITKGLISLLLRVVNNQCPEDILDAEFYFIEKIGLSSHLSPSRANGLMSIVKHIKNIARTIPHLREYKK
jgi:cysteine desulfuration protein SufE